MNAFNKILLLAACIFAGGCYYDSQEALYNNVNKPVNCDTTNVTYSGKVAPIIAANCNSCHSAQNAPQQAPGFVLDNYDGLQLQVFNEYLMGDINHLPGYNAMPNNGSKLSDCDIAIIQQWVNLNTPNN